MADLNPAQQEVFDRLGAPRSERPEFDRALRDQLRLELERELAPLVPHIGDDGLFLSKHKLDRVHGCERRFLEEDRSPFTWSPAVARGIIAHKAVELAATARLVRPPLDLIDEAIGSLQNQGRGVGEWLQRATEAEVDEVRAQANTHLCAFLDCWPPLKREWRPATEASLRAELFEGKVVLGGKPDLTLGQSSGNVAGKVIVDFKSGSYAVGHRSDLHFYALIETLKIGTPPRLLASYYLDSGTLHTEDVTEDLLAATVMRVTDAAAKVIELTVTKRDPVLRASPACRWCPVLDDCETGRAHLDEVDDDW